MSTLLDSQGREIEIGHCVIHVDSPPSDRNVAFWGIAQVIGVASSTCVELAGADSRIPFYLSTKLKVVDVTRCDGRWLIKSREDER
jgi:hypothetical protein